MNKPSGRCFVPQRIGVVYISRRSILKVSLTPMSGRSVSKSRSIATRRICLRLAASASRGRRSPETIAPPITPRVWNTKRRRVTSGGIAPPLPTAHVSIHRYPLTSSPLGDGGLRCRRPPLRSTSHLMGLLEVQSELQQILAEVRVRVGRPGQAAPLQRRDEPIGDLDDVLPGQPRLPWAGDEEPVPPDCFHHLPHALGDLVRCANEFDRPIDPFGYELPQGLPAPPLRERVQRATLAVRRDVRQWLVQIEDGKVDFRN